MKKLVLLLPTLALVLASCGGNDDKKTPTVDPLTLTFTGTGTSTAWKPSQNHSLTATFHGKTQAIGTYNTNGLVNVTLTTDLVKSFPMRSLSEYKTAAMSNDCDTSQLNVTGSGQYYIFNGGDFTEDNQESFVTPGSRVDNSDNTANYNLHTYFYSTQTASIVGKTTCNGTVMTYNLSFKPGWNHLSETFTKNLSTKAISSDQIRVVDQSNTYNGSWLVFDY